MHAASVCQQHDTVSVICMYLAQVESDTLSDLDCGYFSLSIRKSSSMQSLELPDLGLLIISDFYIWTVMLTPGATDEIAVAVIITRSLMPELNNPIIQQ